MLKAVLIDDEELALDVMEILLNEAGGVSVEGKYIHVAEALERLVAIEPDLIFIDIEMPGINGLAAAGEILKYLPNTEIVFVTAHQEYAFNAFEVSAFDYLLKPVSKDRIAKTLNRYHIRKTLPRLSGSKSSTEPEELELIGKATRPCLRLQVLGSMELYDKTGRLMTWRTKKTKEMFAYLWHFGGTPVYRYSIVDDLWPKLPMDKAQALLHTTIYLLRSMLKDVGITDMIMFGDERYWMKTEQIESDAARMAEMLQQRNANPLMVERMLSTYRGDYLEREHYPWAEHKRYHLHAAYIRYLETWLPQADSAMQEAILRQLIKLEPYGAAPYHLLLELLEGRGEMIAASRLREEMEQCLNEE
jgi:two-component system LytT family response regulator